MKKFLCIMLSILAAITFAGCARGGEEPYYSNYASDSCSFYLFAMNGDANLTIYGSRNRQRDARAANLFGEVYTSLTQTEEALSASYPNSDISKFNAAPAGASVQISQITYGALTLALSMYRLTQGYYNPAVYYGVQAFGFNGGVFPKTENLLPTEETTSKYAELASAFGDLQLLEEDGAYYAVKPQKTVEEEGAALSLKIDLGGLGKGYAADKIGGLIDDYGFEYALFNFSSSSLSIKKYNANTPGFDLGFKDPRGAGPQASYGYTHVCDVNVSTSGDYENYFELGGVRYCHIFNPFTCRPVQSGIMSATVMGGSAAENDALTTAIMCMGKDAAIDFIQKNLTSRQVFFTYSHGGGLYYYTNMQGGYTITDGRYTRLTGAEDVI